MTKTVSQAGVLARIACAVRGHKPVFARGIFIDGKSYPSLDVTRCERCGDERTNLFMGGL